MSRAAAINQKCKDCIYDPAVSGTWREQVELCTSSKSCPLWPYRPVTLATVNLQRKEKGALNTDSLAEDEDEVVA